MWGGWQCCLLFVHGLFIAVCWGVHTVKKKVNKVAHSLWVAFCMKILYLPSHTTKREQKNHCSAIHVVVSIFIHYWWTPVLAQQWHAPLQFKSTAKIQVDATLPTRSTDVSAQTELQPTLTASDRWFSTSTAFAARSHTISHSPLMIHGQEDFSVCCREGRGRKCTSG